MPTPAARINLFDLDRRDLEGFFTSLGEKPFRAVQLMKWIYHEGITDFAAMTDVAKETRAALAEAFVLDRPEVVERQVVAEPAGEPARLDCGCLRHRSIVARRGPPG